MSTKTFAIEATYKGETGYITIGAANLAGITPLEENATTFANKSDAEFAASAVRRDQERAEPWDTLTRIQVIELT